MLREREQAIAQQEALLAERERELELRATQDRELLAERERELELRPSRSPHAPDAPAPSPTRSPGPMPRGLPRSRPAWQSCATPRSLFLRTRDELAARSEAVAARERLVAQKERELDDREDAKGEWAPRELTEMEARLSRLEQQQPGEQTLGFSGGLRKLQQGTRPQRRG